MGKFRIPAPVMIKKHWGPTDLNEVAGDVLALSKMNWNTFDLYTRLPATIHSSNEIARIGKLLRRFEREGKRPCGAASRSLMRLVCCRSQANSIRQKLRFSTRVGAEFGSLRDRGGSCRLPA
jgi:hypothetical protein